jgi:urease alpha subunit
MMHRLGRAHTHTDRTGKGNSAKPQGLQEMVEAGAVGTFKHTPSVVETKSHTYASFLLCPSSLTPNNQLTVQ